VLWIGGDYNVTPMFNVAAGYYDQKQKASSDNGQLAGDIYTASLLASYKFSKMTDVYVGYAYSKYKGAAYATGVYTSNNIVGTGLRVRF
jgi:predicted porin